MRLIKSKRAAWDRTLGIVLAVIASVTFLFVISGVAEVIRNPDLGLEGISCRASITAAARTEEITQGTVSLFKKSCNIFDKQIPLKPDGTYIVRGMEEAKRVSDLTADEFREVIMRDLTELVARAWWMTAEGDRPEYLMKRIDDYFTNDNNCLILYGVRIHPSDDYPSFNPITNENLDTALAYYNKSNVFSKVFEIDMSVRDYIMFSGKGGAVIIPEDEPIDIEYKGADTHYGIAVGFKHESDLSQTIEGLLGTRKQSLNPGSSYILIAPYDKIANECDVEEND